MPSENRVPPDDAAPSPRRAVSPPFYRVERPGPDGRVRTYVMHTGSPKFLVEFERPRASDDSPGSEAGASPGRSRPVIRRVCVPNSWSGDYQLCARQLDAAADFCAATEPHDG